MSAEQRDESWSPASSAASVGRRQRRSAPRAGGSSAPIGQPLDGDPPADELISVDLSEPGAVAELVAQLDDDRLDGLVNNAAFQPNLSVAETPDEVWDEVMATNLRAPFQLIRDLAPRLAEVHGGIVNVSSVHAIVTSANVAAYAVSKGALVALTRSAAIDLAPLGVRCNAVLPGAVQTPMLFDGLSRRPHERGAAGQPRGPGGAHAAWLRGPTRGGGPDDRPPRRPRPLAVHDRPDDRHGRRRQHSVVDGVSDFVTTTSGWCSARARPARPQPARAVSLMTTSAVRISEVRRSSTST